MFEITRRGFMVGCSTAIAAMAGGRLGYIAFGSPEQEPNQEILLRRHYLLYRLAGEQRHWSL